jgi:PAS domain S-box-containing protein
MSRRDPPWQQRARTLLSCGVAVTSVLLALLLTRVMESHFESFRTPLFFCAIMLTTWFGGLIPGMIATLLAVLALKYYYLPPLYSLAFDLRHVPLFVIFSVSALCISWVIAKQQHAERAVRKVRDELEMTVRERTATLRRTNEELQAEIAERTRAEEALRSSEERWRAVFENSAVGIALVDSSGCPVAANPALQRMLGYTMDEILTLSLTDLTHDDDLLLTQASIAELIRGTRQQYDLLKRYRRKDGSLIWVNVSGSVVPGSDRVQQFLVEIIEDITDRKLAQDSLRQAQAELAHVTRLTTMGELAASIAHEVNQPLAAVVTNGNACLRWLLAQTPNLPEAREAVQRIIRDGHRAADVILRVRALLKKTGPQKTWLNINDVIHEVLTMAHSEVRKHRVALRTDLAAGLPPVVGDRIQLQQVILNLVMNGMEAMSSVANRSGELLIQSGTHESQGIFVAVQDSGIGLDPQTLDRIFDAFFTTKPEGMGMGLSISRTIIEAHGGRLWAAPHDGPGATFQFTLPMHGESES